MSHATSTQNSLTPSPLRPTAAAVLQALRPLSGSTDPAVVCGHAVRLCAPVLCSSATIELTETTAGPYRIGWPISDTDEQLDSGLASLTGGELQPIIGHRLNHDSVQTPIRPADGDPGPEYGGTLTMWFEQDRPTAVEAMIGQLVVERISTSVLRERLRAAIAEEADRADHLHQALVRNREIGAALGILMASQKCTNEQAFLQIRNISQRTHRKVHELALDVIETGMLEIPASNPDF